MGRKPKKKVPTFESSLKDLEEIVRRLEDEQVPLGESLKLFAEGKKLARVCEAELDTAEKRIRELIDNDDGTVAERKFESGAADDADNDSDHAHEPPKKGSSTVDDIPF